MSGKDETPVQFEEPQWGTRGPRIPEPQQTGWKYKYRRAVITKPTIGGTIFSVIFGGIFIYSGVSLFKSAVEINKVNSEFYFVVAGSIALVFIGGCMLMMPIFQFRNYQENNPPNQKPMKKKMPKRRKDYK